MDEILQEVSLAAVAQKAPLADASKVAPWLYRLAVRQVLLYRRKHGRRRNLVNRFARETQPTEVDRRTVDPLQWLLADERGRQVRAALSTMQARDAEILLLKYAEDWSYHEIASHLGISHSAVEARLHCAPAATTRHPDGGERDRGFIMIKSEQEFTPEELRQLDLLVDGELGNAERRNLLDHASRPARWLEAPCAGLPRSAKLGSASCAFAPPEKPAEKRNVFMAADVVAPASTARPGRPWSSRARGWWNAPSCWLAVGHGRHVFAGVRAWHG